MQAASKKVIRHGSHTEPLGLLIETLAVRRRVLEQRFAEPGGIPLNTSELSELGDLRASQQLQDKKELVK
jgi:hypothetical protein